MSAERDSLRLFAALELADEWRTELVRIQQRQEQASPGYFRWVAPGLLHLTIVFMGSQPAAKLAEIEAALRRAGGRLPPFRLSLGRVGTFGPPRAPRVLWVEAVQPDGRLQQLRQAVEQELRAAGVGFDAKPLRPHVTLGRSRRSSSGNVRPVEASLGVAAHVAREIVLVESRLSTAGPEYRRLARSSFDTIPEGPYNPSNRIFNDCEQDE